jgi:hypothetical protein
MVPDVLNDRYRVRDQFDVLFRYRVGGNYAIGGGPQPDRNRGNVRPVSSTS